jgi:hypothetical protein
VGGDAFALEHEPEQQVVASDGAAPEPPRLLDGDLPYSLHPRGGDDLRADDAFVPAQDLRDRDPHRVDLDAQLGQDPGSYAVLDLEEPQEHVLSADIAVSGALGLGLSHGQHALGLLGEPLEREHSSLLRGHDTGR